MGQVQSPYALRKGKFDAHCWRMAPAIEKLSAITFRVSNMKASVHFYRNVLGMELLYGGEQACFSSLRANDSESAILNLEQGDTVSRWGPADLPCYGCGCFLDASEGERIQS
jgi:hypothetical protein